MTNWITVFTTSAFDCKYCRMVKELLQIYGFDFYEKDIHKDVRYKEEFLKHGFKTVPQVFIESNLIGGYTTSKDYFRKKFFENHPDRDKILKELEELDG